ncbi:MAG TPA: hypothetical protein VFN78_09845 [Ktedonobacterales bacterium]|nr:hypothetical protein [Ktedonobacterales bacterium]
MRTPFAAMVSHDRLIGLAACAGDAITAGGTTMEPHGRRRRRTAQPAQTTTSFAAGEDVVRSTTQERDHSRRELGARPTPRPTPDEDTPPVGDLPPLEVARPERQWRRPTQPQVARKVVTRVAGGAARGATRRLRGISRWRSLSALASVVAFVALFAWFLTGSYWRTRAVEIQGTKDPTLLALVHAQRLTGCDAFLCDFRAARQAIAASTRAQQVSIQVVFPSTTLVRITPRVTTALWRTQGHIWAVGADGVVIGAADHDPSLLAPGAAQVDDPTNVAFSGRTPMPGARIDPALVAMARQLRMSSAGAGLDASSLRLTAADGFTMTAAHTSSLVVFGGPGDAAATFADVRRASPAPEMSQSAESASLSDVWGATPAQAAQGAQIQAEAAASILAQLARSGASASLIDVRWGSHPYYR